MGWSNDQFTGTLVLPTGATVGPRIVLDGETGVITVYNAANQAVAVVSSTEGFETNNSTGRSAQLDPLGVLRFTDTQYWDNPATLTVFNSLANFGFSTLLQSAYNDAGDGTAPVGIILDPGSQSGSPAATVKLTTIDSSTKTNLVLDETDLGRGILDYTDIDTNTATTTTTETIGINSDTVTFETGRAYEIIIKGYVSSSISGDNVQVRARKTGTAGQILIASMSGYTIPGANLNVPFYLGTIVRNATGANITDDVVVTYFRNSGTGNVRITADATHHAYVTIKDIGTSDAYPNAPELT